MKKIIFALVLSGVMSLCLKAQVPAQAGSADTIYVEEEPIVYTIPLEVEEGSATKFYLSAQVSAFNNYSRYVPCKGCDEFLEDYKTYITPELNYSAGLSLLYAPQNWVLEGGVEYTQIKEHFSFTNGFDSTFSSDNKFTYLDIKATGGYWLWRDKKICSLILQGGLAYNVLLNSSGMVNDFYSGEYPVDISSSGKLRTHQLSGTLGARFVFLPQSRLKISLEPYYMGSLLNITQKYYPYAELYNRVGLKGGIIFSL